MSEIKTSYLDERRNDVVKALEAYNAALKSNDAVSIRKTESALKDAEAEYAKQKAVEVKDEDTPEVLQKRVMEQAEWIILPEATEEICKEIVRGNRQ